MADATKTFAFTQHSATRPKEQQPGTELDNQFADHRAAINDTRRKLEDIRRSDGALNNGIVTRESLAPGLEASLTAAISTQAVPAQQAAQQAAAISQNSQSLAEAAARQATQDAALAKASADIVTQNANLANANLNKLVLDAQSAQALVAADAAAISNDANHAHQDANRAGLYAELSELWAEWMGDGNTPGDQTLPPNKLKEMGITGDHWSARWWANKAAGAFGSLTSLYLGVHPTHAAATASAQPPIPHGAIYYNSTEKRPYVWANGSWSAFYQPSRAYASQLVYVSSVNQTELDLTTSDTKGENYTLDDPSEALDVYVNGVRLTQSNAVISDGDYTVDAPNNKVLFNRPIPADSIISVDIYTPASKLAPGTINFHHLQSIDIDPVTLAPGVVDGVKTRFSLVAIDTTVMNVGSPQELLVSIDGVVQEAGRDYQAAGAQITFSEAPQPDSRVFMLWMQPGGTGGGGKGVLPPTPPNDAFLNNYQWMPGVGAGWGDARTNLRTVATEYDLGALIDPDHIKPGSMAICEDTYDIFIYQDDVGGIGKHWERFIPHHGNGPIRQKLIYDPSTPQGTRVAWADDRAALQVVADLDDLSNRNILPASHLVQGKLVFCQEDATIYELAASPAAMTNTVADWKPISGGVTFVARVGNLPDPVTTNLADGQLFCVKLDIAGGPLYRLMTWDALAAPAGATQLSAMASQIVTLPSAGVIVEFDFQGQQLVENIEWDITFTTTNAGVVAQHNFVEQTPIGSSAADAAAILVAVIGLAWPHGLAQIDPMDARRIEVLCNDGAQVTGFNVVKRLVGQAARNGQYVALNRRNWTKALRADPDQPSDVRRGDFIATLEAEHKELKIADENGVFQLIYSEDNVKNWIAALSLFEGTAKEVGGTAVGAVELDNLPDLAVMQAAVDLSKVSHYWVWVGLPNTDVTTTTPRIGTDLDGAVLSVGDWIQISNRGTAAAPQLRYVHIGGDLLAKSRGDRLFGLQDWTAGSWESGSLVVHNGDVYRASQGIVPTDASPSTVLTLPAVNPWSKLDISGGLKVAQDDAALPATGAPAGQVWIVLSSSMASGKQGLFAWDAAASRWENLGGGEQRPLSLDHATELIGVGLPVGAVTAYAGATAPDGWLLCDGAAFDATIYKELNALLGANRTPDLTGQFIRGGTPAAGFPKVAWTTGLPKAGLRTNNTGSHAHLYTDPLTGGGTGIKGATHFSGEAWLAPAARAQRTATEGAHEHTVTGGDTETAPNHVVLAYIIKALDRTTVVRAP